MPFRLSHRTVSLARAGLVSGHHSGGAIFVAALRWGRRSHLWSAGKVVSGWTAHKATPWVLLVEPGLVVWYISESDTQTCV
jgi:hypothetical protein